MRKPTPYAHAMAWQVCRLLKMISSVRMALDMFSGGKKWKGFDKFWVLDFFGSFRSSKQSYRQSTSCRVEI